MGTVVMLESTSVAANATTDNVFQGKRFERSPVNGYVTYYSTGSATGLQDELNIGGRSITPRNPVNTQNRLPVVPDDLIVSGVPVARGELIQVTVANTTAGALTHNGRIEIQSA